MKARPAQRGLAERNALVEQYIYLPAWCIHALWAHNRPLRRLGWDDAVQNAALGLIRAADLWDPSKGTFTTYAAQSIRRHLIRACQDIGLIHVPSWVQRKGTRGPCREHARRARVCHGLPTEGVVAAAARPPGVEAEEALEALDKLSARSRLVLERCVMGGQSYQAVADGLGITRERVRQIKVKALAALRAVLGH
jgi:RNA polymerase sigma factor (sigma-70 family)